MHDHLSRTRASVQSKLSTNKFTIDDPFQQQISIENIFDAIKVISTNNLFNLFSFISTDS
jgi:hypothetical protein